MSIHTQVYLLSHVPSHSLVVSSGWATAVLVNINGMHNHYSGEKMEIDMEFDMSLQIEI